MKFFILMAILFNTYCIIELHKDLIVMYQSQNARNINKLPVIPKPVEKYKF